MRLIVNGEDYELEQSDALPVLLNELGLDPRRVAVLINDEAVPAAARQTYKLCDGDRVELLGLAGGG